MAKCIPIPKLDAPALPTPFNAKGPDAPTLPAFDPNLCCKTPPLPIKKPKIPISPLIVAAAIPFLKNASDAVNAWIDAHPIACPRE